MVRYAVTELNTHKNLGPAMTHKSGRSDLAELLAALDQPLGRLSGGFAHNLNNLFTAIRGFNELAMESLPEDHPAIDSLEMVKNASTEAIELTESFQAFVQGTHGEAHVFDLGARVSQWTSLLRHVTPSSVLIQAERGPQRETRALFSDGTLLLLLFYLTTESARTMPKGGKIKIECGIHNVRGLAARSADGPAPQTCAIIRLRLERDDPGATSDPFLADLLEESSSANGAGESDASDPSLRHLSDVLADSGVRWEVAQVSDLTGLIHIYIPLAPREPRDSRSAIDPVSSQSKARILLIEPDAYLASIIMTTLESAGLVARDVRSAEAALELMPNSDDRFELVILDSAASETEPCDTITRIKGIDNKTSVIVIAGLEETDRKLEAAADAIMRRPFQMSELAGVVRSILDEPLT